MSKLETAITLVVKEAIEIKASLQELERAFPYLPGNYYYARKQQLERRQVELVAILEMAEIGYTNDAPLEQWLVTRY
jgi:hypothetical protein